MSDTQDQLEEKRKAAKSLAGTQQSLGSTQQSSRSRKTTRSHRSNDRFLAALEAQKEQAHAAPLITGRSQDKLDQSSGVEWNKIEPVVSRPIL